MITQKFHKGKKEIRIEIAESIDDAKKNDFKDGQYQRYYIDNKPTDSYMSVINFIVSESKNNEKFIPDEKTFLSSRNELFKNQKKQFEGQFENIKKMYKDMNVPQEQIDKIDDFKNKINIEGVRMKR